MYILIIIFLTLLYFYGTRNHNYWKKKGIVYEEPLPFFGNLLPRLLQRISLTDFFVKLYWQFPDEKLVGFYAANNLDLVIRDPDIAKQVLVSDFQYFYPRGLNHHPEAIEPMLKNLFFADGDLWKLLRQRMTPAFSTGKLKAMFPLIVESAEKLQVIAASSARSGKEVNVRDLMARYTTDFIGACGFGINADSLNHEDSEFRKLGKRIFEINFRDALVIMLKLVFPGIFKHFHNLSPYVERTTVNLMREIMGLREYKPSGRHDFVDLLLEMKEKGKIIGESIEKVNDDGSPATCELEMDDLLMAAQMFVFFAAGFETSSSASSYLLHQLAFHPEVQKKCQEEIDDVLSRYDNKLCYDAVKELKYLEMAFKESLRMFPSLGFLVRKSAKKYTFQGTDLTIDKGVSVFIPVQALQNDEKYFENPKEFRPERFHPDNIQNINKHIYLPFGAGPRACIGERLGVMQSLAGVAALLSQFNVEPSLNTKRIPIPEPTSTIVQSIKGGLPLSLSWRGEK